MRANGDFTIQVSLERREDGGLRVWSEAIPELVLSHSSPEQVLDDLPKALEAIFSSRLGGIVSVEEVAINPRSALHKEFTARAA